MAKKSRLSLSLSLSRNRVKVRKRQSSLTSFFARLRAAFLTGPRRQCKLGLQNRSEIREAGLAARGFTIVELLIVVVVIAILAAITIVSYNGISRKATESAIKSDLNTAAKQLSIAKVESGSYPSNTSGIKTSGDATYAYSATSDTFCLSATKGAVSFKITEAGAIVEGDCGATTGPTMQAFTPSQCSALTTYTGANESAIITLTDTRADKQEYQVAKLKDGKCWMLNNLRLGSTTSATTLTPSDSDVASNFTLPQLNNGTRAIDTSNNPGNDYDTPYAYYNIPGDTGSGATNYGYLYNFSAAIAGGSRMTVPEGFGHAQHSICAKGWKLPTGGSAIGASDFSSLDIAFDGSGSTQIGAPGHLTTGWLNSGAFKGVLSGYWNGGFSLQGTYGYFWSRSVDSNISTGVYDAYFLVTAVNPVAENASRAYGRAVRCILN